MNSALVSIMPLLYTRARYHKLVLHFSMWKTELGNNYRTMSASFGFQCPPFAANILRGVLLSLVGAATGKRDQRGAAKGISIIPFETQHTHTIAYRCWTGAHKNRRILGVGVKYWDKQGGMMSVQIT